MDDARLHEVVDRLVKALHEAATDVGITEDELWSGIGFLTEVGRAGEFALLSDVLGISIMVDGITHDANDHATATNVQGPVYLAGAPMLPPPFDLADHDEPGEPLFVSGSVTSSETGAPLPGAVLDVWQTDTDGRYSNENAGVGEFHLRGLIPCDGDGRYRFRTIVPPPYEVPKDGPVGRLLAALGRTAFRPAHVHVKTTCEGYEPLTTMVFFEGDPWLAADAIDAVKSSLVVRLDRSDDPAAMREREVDRAFATMTFEIALRPSR